MVFGWIGRGIPFPAGIAVASAASKASLHKKASINA